MWPFRSPRSPPSPPPAHPSGTLHLHFVSTDRAVILGSLALLVLAYEVLHRARHPPSRPSLLRRVSSLLRREGAGAVPAAYDPHPMWSAPSKLRYGWTFFAALLVGLVAVIFVGSFATARVVYTACSLSLLAYRVSYYAERGLLLYCVDLCYWVHLVGLAALWLAELPGEWALAALASAVGPVGGAVFMLQSPLLLHHPEAIAPSPAPPRLCRPTPLHARPCALRRSSPSSCTWCQPGSHAWCAGRGCPEITRDYPSLPESRSHTWCAGG